MEVILYTCSDDKRTVWKSLATIKTVQNATAYMPCDILAPKLIIDYDSTLLSCNYVKITDFSRWYFINDITLDSGNRMILSCIVDPLYTYSEYIDDLVCTIVRNENAPDNYMVDPIATFTPNKSVQIYKFPNTPFNARDMSETSKNYVLVIGGGHVSGN